MANTKAIIKNDLISLPGFLSHYLIFLIIGLTIVFSFNKGDIVLLLNQNANTNFDFFFMSYTHLGLGIMFLLVALFVCFFQFSLAISSLINLLLNGLIVLTFKQLFFSGLPRPTAFFENTDHLRLIDGFVYHSSHSFPSGHTLTAFAIASFLAWIFKNRNLSAILFLYAFLIGISRIYLLQHFFIDVLVGSVLGISSTVLSIFIHDKWLSKIHALEFDIMDIILPRLSIKYKKYYLRLKTIVTGLSKRSLLSMQSSSSLS